VLNIEEESEDEEETLDISDKVVTIDATE